MAKFKKADIREMPLDPLLAFWRDMKKTIPNLPPLDPNIMHVIGMHFLANLGYQIKSERAVLSEGQQ